MSQHKLRLASYLLGVGHKFPVLHGHSLVNVRVCQSTRRVERQDIFPHAFHVHLWYTSFQGQGVLQQSHFKYWLINTTGHLLGGISSHKEFQMSQFNHRKDIAPLLSVLITDRVFDRQEALWSLVTVAPLPCRECPDILETCPGCSKSWLGGASPPCSTVLLYRSSYSTPEDQAVQVMGNRTLEVG